ncbi:MAG: hypothetical protein ACTSUV_00100 [Candidatus Ranarchaeia archaeon]
MKAVAVNEKKTPRINFSLIKKTKRVIKMVMISQSRPIYFNELKELLKKFTSNSNDNILKIENFKNLENTIDFLFEKKNILPKNVTKKLVDLYVTCGAVLEGIKTPKKINQEMKNLLATLQSY